MLLSIAGLLITAIMMYRFLLEKKIFKGLVMRNYFVFHVNISICASGKKKPVHKY